MTRVFSGATKLIAILACAYLVLLATGCSARSKSTPATTPTAFESTTPCPLVTDADLAALNPVLKRAGDDWWERDGSIHCDISFGVNFATVSGNNLKPGELLGVSAMRTADILARFRLPRDLCTDPGYAHIGECIPLKGIGDYAFYIKTFGPPKVYRFKGRGYHAMPHEVVRAISGPYEIEVDAGYWIGGSPKRGAIELAKKLAAQYH